MADHKINAALKAARWARTRGCLDFHPADHPLTELLNALNALDATPAQKPAATPRPKPMNVRMCHACHGGDLDTVDSAPCAVCKGENVIEEDPAEYDACGNRGGEQMCAHVDPTRCATHWNFPDHHPARV